MNTPCLSIWHLMQITVLLFQVIHVFLFTSHLSIQDCSLNFFRGLSNNNNVSQIVLLIVSHLDWWLHKSSSFWKRRGWEIHLIVLLQSYEVDEKAPGSRINCSCGCTYEAWKLTSFLMEIERRSMFKHTEAKETSGIYSVILLLNSLNKIFSRLRLLIFIALWDYK